MDQLKSMEVFAYVVETGSFSAAAKQMHISAPMVGKHIRLLEEHLSVRLLTKTTRQQQVTEIGQQYYEHCKSVLGEVAAVEARLEVLGSTPRGLLRLNAPVTFGSLCLAPALAAFLEQYPNIQVDLALSDRVTDLLANGYDAVIRIGEVVDLSLTARPMQPYRMVLCASPSFLEKAGSPRTPEDLKQTQCLNFSLWNYQRDWGLANIAAGLPPGRFRSNSGQALRMIALEGAGIILQPELLLKDDLKQGRLVPVLEAFAPPMMPMNLLYVRGHHMAPKLRTFINFVLDRFGAEGHELHGRSSGDRSENEHFEQGS